MPPSTQPTAPADHDPAVNVALHGDTAELHDAIVGRVGDFDRVLAAIAELRAAGPRAITCETTIVASNAAALPQIVALAIAAGVGRCVLMHGEGDALVPLDHLLEKINEAVACARAAGVDIVVRGVPACLFADVEPEPRGPNRPGFACLFEAHCDLSERCPGLAHAHIRLHGWGERRLRPVPRTRPWHPPHLPLAPGVHAAWLALLGPAAAAVERVVLERRLARFTIRLGPRASLALELTPHDDSRPRFARSRSFDIRYTRAEGSLDPREFARLLAPIVAAIVERDHGALSLDPRHGLPPLPPRPAR